MIFYLNELKNWKRKSLNNSEKKLGIGTVVIRSSKQVPIPKIRNDLGKEEIKLCYEI